MKLLLNNKLTRAAGLLLSLLALLGLAGSFAINARATQLFSLETTPINNFGILRYCIDEVQDFEPSAFDFRLIKILRQDGLVTFQCRYSIPDGGGYGGSFEEIYFINKTTYCQNVYGVFAWATRGATCKYFVEFSNTDLTVINGGRFKIERISFDSGTDGKLYVGSRRITPSYNNVFRNNNLGNFKKGDVINLTLESTYRGIDYVSSSSDPSRTQVSSCGTDCWVVQFEASDNFDFDDLIVRVSRV